MDLLASALNLTNHPTIAVQYSSGATNIRSSRLCRWRRGCDPSEVGGRVKTVNAFSKESHCVVRSAFGARKLDKSELNPV
jgi:hypothetical protein